MQCQALSSLRSSQSSLVALLLGRNRMGLAYLSLSKWQHSQLYFIFLVKVLEIRLFGTRGQILTGFCIWTFLNILPKPILASWFALCVNINVCIYF